MVRYEWKCIRCGKCCEHIVTDTPFGKFGMMLLPFEVKRFSSKYIKPLYGVGVKGKRRKRPAIIYAYQYINEPCEHYNPETKTCSIYEKRPLVCRAYPFEFAFGTYLVDNNCPAVKQFLPLNETTYLDEIEGINVEYDALRKLRTYYMLVFLANMYKTNVLITWAFDLNRNKWIQFNYQFAMKIIERLQEGI